jgi:hypothetical protein
MPGSRTWTRVLLAAVLGVGAVAADASAQNRAGAPNAGDWPRSSGRDGYILSLEGQWLSSDVNLEEVTGTRAGKRGDFLWFRRSGKGYVIDDPAALARAVALFEPVRALEPEQDAIRDRERALDDRENALDRQEEEIDAELERLEPSDEDEGGDDEYAASAPSAAADPAERDELERRMDEVRAKQTDLRAEQHDLDRDERALDAREERLERDAEAQLWRLLDDLVASGAAKPIGAR